MDCQVEVSELFTNKRYFETICKKRVLQVSHFVEPYSDLAMYLQRVQLQYQSNNCKVKNILIKSNIALFAFLKLFKTILFSLPNNIDFNVVSENFKSVELATLVFFKPIFRYQLNVIFHDSKVVKLSFFKKIMLNFLLKFVKNTYFLTNSVLKLYKNQNVKIINSKLDSIFLPAQAIGLKSDFKKFEGLEGFLKLHDSLIVVSCPELIMLEKNDQYCIDWAIEILRKLKQSNSSTGLVILISKVLDWQYYNYLELLVQAYGLQESIYFLVGCTNQSSVIQKASIFLVSGNDKNQHVNIHDALSFNIKTIVNDEVSKKFTGVLTFKAGDFEDLYLKIFNSIKKEENLTSSLIKRGRPKKVIALDV